VPRCGGRPTTIKSPATYVPPRVLTNADLEKMVDTTDEWILQRTGIRERHIVDPGVATSDLGKEAAARAIERAGLTADDIGFVVVGTVTPDMMFPSTACLVQHKIGARHAWGFDLSAACSAFTYALTTASQMVATGAHEHALVVGADVMSSIIDYRDRSTCVLFGAGGISYAQDFYKGKTIHFIVGYSAGGSFDQYTRFIARHIGKHIPGNPSTVVENMTGAPKSKAIADLLATAVVQ
jgi:3-oxoacyl-(acyl-carrier-protein) synthase III